MRLVTCWYQARNLLSLFPPPSCFYMNSIDSSATKGKRKGSLCTRHIPTFFFSPTLKLFFFSFQKSHAIKMSLFAIIFFYTIPNRKIFIHSLVSGRKETAKQRSALCWRWRDGRGSLWMNQEQKSCGGDRFKHRFSYVWLSSCDRIKPCLSHPQFQPHNLLWGTQGCSLKVFVKLQLDDPHGVWHYTGAWLSYIVQSCCNQERKDRGKGHCNQVIAFRCYHFIVSSRGAAAELIRAQMRMKAWSPLSVLVLLHFFCCFYKVTE